MTEITRPSPWRTPEAVRTYVSGGLWALGLVLVFVVGHGPDQAGWWRIRTDAAGWTFLAGALVGAGTSSPGA